MKDLRKIARERPLRVMLDCFMTKHSVSVAYKLRERGVEIVYWTGDHMTFWESARKDKKSFPNTIFHHGIDYLQAIPAPGVDVSKFEPPGIQLTRSMLECESQVLRMMDAVDYSNLPLSRKKHIYYEYLKYWNGVLTHFNIDAILFQDIPHTVCDYVVFSLAKKLGIKTIMYTALKFPDRLIFLNDDFPEYKEVKREYERALAENVSLKDLSPDLQKFFYNQTNWKNSGASFYDHYAKGRDEKIVHAMRIIPSIESIVRNIRQFTFPQTTYWYFKMLFGKKRMASLDNLVLSGFALRRKMRAWGKIKGGFKKEYVQFAKIPDFSKKFVYVPLHMQPERTTSTHGDIFVDQILMVDVLSAALPEGWMLYVKDHPAQWIARRAHLGRYTGYYRTLSQIKNVLLVPPETSTKDLMEKSEAVATVIGTALIEGVLLGKPGLMFGNESHMHCEGIFKIYDTAGARVALEKIKSGYAPDQAKVLAFLVALDRVSVPGHSRSKRNKTREITDDEAVEYLFNAFYKRLMT